MKNKTVGEFKSPGTLPETLVLPSSIGLGGNWLEAKWVSRGERKKDNWETLMLFIVFKHHKEKT